MSRFINQRRLARVQRMLARARAELEVVEQQLVALADDADDARVRALVSEDANAVHLHRDASRHAEAMVRSRDATLQSIVRLEHERETLLDRLVVEHR